MKINESILSDWLKYQTNKHKEFKAQVNCVIPGSFGIKIPEEENRDFYGFTLRDGHIYGKTFDTNGTRILFVTALEPHKNTKLDLVKVYVLPQNYKDRKDYGWKSMYISISAPFLRYAAEVRRYYHIKNVKPIPLAEQFDRNRRSISDEITSGRKWKSNSVYGFKKDIKAQTIGVATDVFTKEEKMYYGFDRMPKMKIGESK